MPDEINTGEHGGAHDHGPRELHPADTVLMQCVDVVALGKRPETFGGKDKGLVSKCAIVFRSTEKREDGTHFDLSREFTISTGPRASLRAMLESWRGQPYTEDWPNVPLHQMVGVWALVTVIHRPSKDGSKTYANIGSVVPVPKPMRQHLPTLPQYDRAEWWSERVAKYASEAAQYLAANGTPTPAPSKPTGKPAPVPVLPDPEDTEDYAGGFDDDDSLPF